VANSPNLEFLMLRRVCVILPDEAPGEVNRGVKSITYVARSAILSPTTTLYDTLPAFLAHFPCLEEFRLWMNDEECDNAHSNTDEDVTAENPGSYALLLQKLQPLALHLTSLEIPTSDHGDNPRPPAYVHHVLPCTGFRNFTALKHVEIPYNCLLADDVAPELDAFRSPYGRAPATHSRDAVHLRS
jgi:hypothetical protein